MTGPLNTELEAVGADLNEGVTVNEIIDFAMNRKFISVYAMKPATFNLIFHIIRMLSQPWWLDIPKDID